MSKKRTPDTFLSFFFSLLKHHFFEKDVSRKIKKPNRNAKSSVYRLTSVRGERAASHGSALTPFCVPAAVHVAALRRRSPAPHQDGQPGTVLSGFCIS